MEHYKEDLEARDSQIVLLRGAIEMLEQNIQAMQAREAQFQERMKESAPQPAVKRGEGPEEPRR